MQPANPCQTGNAGAGGVGTCHTSANQFIGLQCVAIALLEENLYARRAPQPSRFAKNFVTLAPEVFPFSSGGVARHSLRGSIGSTAWTQTRAGPGPCRLAVPRQHRERMFHPSPSPGRATTGTQPCCHTPFAQAQLLDRRQPPEPERALPEKL